MYKIAVTNMKGGCGKTTIATSLAAYYADKGKITSLTDYDPQGSSMRWLKLRDSEKLTISGIDVTKINKLATLSWKLRPSSNTDISIIDTAAGIDLYQLRKIVVDCNILLIPVMPSQVDIHAATRFIEFLLIQGKVKAKGIKIAIIANRIHTQAHEYRSFQKFLKHLNIPIIATLRNVQGYVDAFDNGIGIHDIQEKSALHERYQWVKLIHWLEKHNPDKTKMNEASK